jgi:hypothetical protein
MELIRWMKERGLRDDQMIEVLMASETLLIDARARIKAPNRKVYEEEMDCEEAFAYFSFTQEDVEETVKIIQKDILS